MAAAFKEFIEYSSIFCLFVNAILFLAKRSLITRDTKPKLASEKRINGVGLNGSEKFVLIKGMGHIVFLKD